MKKHPVVLGIAFAWLLPVIAIACALWLTPNALLRVSSVGTFLSATSTPGGILSNPVTNVQASGGSVVVDGAFSASRAQALEVRATTKDGLQLCTAGESEICADLAGPYAGPMRVMPESRSALSHDAWTAWGWFGEYWFLVGTLVFMLAAGFAADESRRLASAV